MKKLVIDIKDGYAAIAAVGDFAPQFLKIEFDEADFINSSGEARAFSSLDLFELGKDKIGDHFSAAEEITLVLPMRFSLIKPISIDVPAIENIGDEFLSWETKLQLPEELGEFATGFYKLRKSYDGRSYKYLFYALASDFVEVLAKFIGNKIAVKPHIESEAYGLFQAINLASEGQGIGAAVSLEHDGAAVVVVHDGDFVAGKFISGDNPSLGEEIMYYVIANAPDDVPPKVLVCGDLEYLENLGSLDWAEILKLPESLGLKNAGDGFDPNFYIVAAGLNLKRDE